MILQSCDYEHSTSTPLSNQTLCVVVPGIMLKEEEIVFLSYFLLYLIFHFSTSHNQTTTTFTIITKNKYLR